MRKITSLLALLGIIVSAGCQALGTTPHAQPAAATTRPVAAGPAGDADYLPRTSVQVEPPKSSETAVENALQWAAQYREASEKLAVLQQEKRDLLEKQQKTQEQVARLQGELTAAQTQLKDANAMLQDMRSELEKWKKDVLGFRDEMREAQKAQMDALAKVLRLLSSELPAGPSAPAAAAPAAPSPAPAGATIAPAKSAAGSAGGGVVPAGVTISAAESRPSAKEASHAAP